MESVHSPFLSACQADANTIENRLGVSAHFAGGFFYKRKGIELVEKFSTHKILLEGACMVLGMLIGVNNKCSCRNFIPVSYAICRFKHPHAKIRVPIALYFCMDQKTKIPPFPSFSL